ncbi:MAG: phage tail tape measure protein, partial [Candidatus Pacearchaeota archaeon]
MSLFSAKLASLFVDIVVNSRRANTVLYQFNNNVKRSGAQVNAFRQQLILLGLASSSVLLVMKAAHLLKQAFDALLETAARLEKNFLEVQKNLRLSAEGFASLQQETLDFTTTVTGIDLDKFQQILITSSRMGLEGKDNLLNFSKAVALVARVSEGVDESSLSEFLYRLSETFGRNAKDAIYLGNTLVALSNALAVNEAQIISTTEKLMGSAEVLGLTAEQTLAFAANARSLGITTERAGSGLARIFQVLASDALSVGRTIFEDNEQAAIDFAKTVETDPAKALQIFFQEMKRLSESGKDFQAILKDIDLEDRRVAETVKIHINRLQNLEKSLNVAGAAQGNVNDLQAKSEQVAGGLQARIDRLSNAWEELKNTIASNESFVVLIEELRGLVEIINSISTAIEANPLHDWLRLITDPSKIWMNLAKLSHKIWPTDTGVDAVSDAVGAAGPPGRTKKEKESRVDTQLEEERFAKEKEFADTAEEIFKELALERIKLIENEYLREKALEENAYNQKIEHLRQLHNEEKLGHLDYADALNEENALHKERQRQLEKEFNNKREEERLRKFKEFQDMINEIISLEKEWMSLREEQNIEGTDDSILRGLMEIEAQYKRNIERIKELEAERAKAEDRPINKDAIDQAVADEEKNKEARAKKFLEDANKNFRQGLGDFVLSDAEKQAQAIKEKFEDLKKQAA